LLYGSILVIKKVKENKMKQQTAVEWLVENTSLQNNLLWEDKIQQAKEMEKNDTDNKAIHFAEWLTNKHTSTLITLYERFEEEHYKSK
jgi:hypothetical protein